jgi:predicted esterase
MWPGRTPPPRPRSSARCSATSTAPTWSAPSATPSTVCWPGTPDLQPLLDENLSDKGRETLDAIGGQCTDEITDNFGHQTTSEWTKDGRSLDELLTGMPEARTAMEDQHIGAPGNPLPTAPVMIISGRYDQNVEYNQAKDLAEHWSGEGVPVTYRNDIMPPLADYNHFVQAISGGPFGISFLLDRFNGVPYGEGITDGWA